MYQVVVVNESEGKSLKSSQRVLAKYLPQIAQYTYAGSLSLEGIDDLEKELKAVRSKHTCVICYHLKNDHSRPLLFIVGNRTKIDIETGTYAFRSRKLNSKPAHANMSYLHQLHVKIGQLAGLWHDLGKANKGFQSYIKKAYMPTDYPEGCPQFIRHDAAGFLVLITAYLASGNEETRSLVSTLTTEAISKAVAVLAQECSTAELLSIKFKELYSTLSVLWETNPQDLEKGLACPPRWGTFIDYAVFYLILTHHRLVGVNEKQPPPDLRSVKDLGYRDSLDRGYHTYINEGSKEYWKDCITYEDLTWVSNIETRQKLVVEEYTLLRVKVIDELGSVPNSDAKKTALFLQNFLATLVYWDRSLLISADHTGSALKSDYKNGITEEESKTKIMANATDYFNKKTRKIETTCGDTLPTHLLTVYGINRKLNALISASLVREDAGLYRSIDGFELKKLSDMMHQGEVGANIDFSAAAFLMNAKSKAPPTRFTWQDEASTKLKACRKTHSFVCVTAETGSGKTIASAKIMYSLSPTLRFNYCLGLKSLSLQTGLSYQQDVGLSDTQLAVVIGDLTAKKQFETNNSELSASTFSESFFDEEYVSVEKGEISTDGWFDYLKQSATIEQMRAAVNDKVNKIISTPVVVCTIDQIIGAVDHSHLKNPMLSLRLFSSDLILDEIDNYSVEDLRHVARLVFYTGMAGRNVVIMSATVSAEISSSLFNHYTAGLCVYKSMTPTSCHLPVTLAQVSNLVPCQIKSYDTAVLNEAFTPTSLLASDAFSQIQEFNKKAYAEVLARPGKSLVSNLPVTRESVYADITKSLFKLHDTSSSTLLTNGSKSISVGFVRLNTVKEARKYTRYLLETSDLPNDVGLSVACYHSKYSPLELGALDKKIATLTNRKKIISKEYPFSEEAHELIKKLESSYIDKNRLMVVIVTTSIMETGRDFDFDYAVLEPSSVKSLIQAAGRVRRHRETDYPLENVLLLSETFRSMLSTGPVKITSVYANPGPFTNLVKMARFGLPPGCIVEDRRILGNTEKLTKSAKEQGVAFADSVVNLSSNPSIGSAFILGAGPLPKVVSSADILGPYSQSTTTPARYWDFVDYWTGMKGVNDRERASFPAWFQSSEELLAACRYLSKSSFGSRFRSNGTSVIKGPFSLISLDQVKSVNVLPSSVRVLKHPLYEGLPTLSEVCVKDSIDIADARRILMTLGVPGSDKNTVIYLQKELDRYSAKGWTKIQLMELATYCLNCYTQNSQVWYNSLIGYNDASSDYENNLSPTLKLT